MKNIKLTLTTCLCLLLSGTLFAQDLETILQEHYAATGMEKRAKIDSYVMVSQTTVGGMEFPTTTYLVRPSKMRTEVTFQGQTIVTVYTGDDNWMVNPMTGSMTPQPLDPDQAKMISSQADFDGHLYDYEKKGYEVTYEGAGDVEGTETYMIKVATSEGDEFIYHLDKDNYIPIMVSTVTTMQGVQVTAETYMSDYRMVDGVAFPYSIETKANGNTTASVIIKDIQVGKKLDNSLFVRPSGSDTD
ncbi:MAG: hypothetical protein AAGI38_00350 [Bacteroidota bacterium]